MFLEEGFLKQVSGRKAKIFAKKATTTTTKKQKQKKKERNLKKFRTVCVSNPPTVDPRFSETLFP